MDALSVISLEQAKAELVMTGIDDRDAEITRLIKTAVSWVEQYTYYKLYERIETYTTYSNPTDFPYFPIKVDSVESNDVDYPNYTTKQLPLALRLSAPSESIVKLLVGYGDVEDVPEPLISACYKLITYLFENRDMYPYQIPSDIQMLINQFRRSII